MKFNDKQWTKLDTFSNELDLGRNLLDLLNMSNILCVTTNPPPIFTLEMKAARAASEVTVSLGM